MSEIEQLNVYLYEGLIGQLILLPGDKILFSFSPEYIKNSERSTLSLSFMNENRELISDIKPTHTRLPSFFSNLLPEGHLREYLAEASGVKKQREFFLLAMLGEDLPGALVIKSADGKQIKVKDHYPEDHKKKGKFKFSLAGVQLKFSAIMERNGRLTIPVEGKGGSWIVKLPSLHFSQVPENEFSMMYLAKQMGMDVPDIQLIDMAEISGMPENLAFLKGNALAIKRFDRTEKGSIHIEDFAQVFGVYPESKYKSGNYKNIAEVLKLECAEKDLEEFIRRLVFNTLIGNADMHLKNWSLIYKDKKHASLAPAYDFVSTISYINDETMALNYVKSKKMSDLSIQLLKHFSAKAKIPEKIVLKTSQETVQKFLEIWNQEKKHFLLSAADLQKIENNFNSIPLVHELHKAFLV